MNAWDFTSYFPGLNITAVAETKKSWILFSPDQVIKILKPLHVEGEEKSNVLTRTKSLKDECDLMKIFAPSVPDKVIQLKSQESIVEAALLMRRLPREFNLLARLLTNKVNSSELRRVGVAIAKVQKKLPAIKEAEEHISVPNLIRQLDEVTEPLLEPGAGIFLAHNIVMKIKDKLYTLISNKERFINSRIKSKKIKQLHGNLHADSVFSEPDKVSLMDAVLDNEGEVGDILYDIGCIYKDIVLFVDTKSAKAFVRACLGKTPKGNEQELLTFFDILWTLKAFNQHTAKLYSGTGSQVDTELVQRFRDRLVRFVNPLPTKTASSSEKPKRTADNARKPKSVSRSNKSKVPSSLKAKNSPKQTGKSTSGKTNPKSKSKATKKPAAKAKVKKVVKKPASKTKAKKAVKKPAAKAKAKKSTAASAKKKTTKKAKGKKTISSKFKNLLGIKKSK